MSTQNKSWRDFFFITTLMVVAVSLFASAAIWQNYRYQYKKMILHRISSHYKTPTLTLPNYNSLSARDMEFTSVMVSGYYLPEKWFFVDDPSLGTQHGYTFMVPFIVSGTGHAILINMGWLPKDDAFSKPTQKCLAAISNKLPASHRVYGVARKFPPKRWFFRTSISQGGRVISRLDDSFLSKHLSKSVDAWHIVTPSTPDNHCLRANDQRLQGIYPERHLGYVYQWLTFMACSLFFYIVYAYRFFIYIHKRSS
ncbi:MULTISPECIES: SURF1 family protein [Candidatus Ichthyocystis]|uniref:SURF1 family protein n=1 Tax=Candidatus Ichthyocystis TaxID=2929841 RepID=UPI000B82E028|nr:MULTISPECIES: SURF1 family protein [Ichthyocystis]